MQVHSFDFPNSGRGRRHDRLKCLLIADHLVGYDVVADSGNLEICLDFCELPNSWLTKIAQRLTKGQPSGMYGEPKYLGTLEIEDKAYEALATEIGKISLLIRERERLGGELSDRFMALSKGIAETPAAIPLESQQH